MQPSGGTCLWYSQEIGICLVLRFPPLAWKSAVSLVAQDCWLRQRFFPLEAGLGLPPLQARGPEARMSRGMLVPQLTTAASLSHRLRLPLAGGMVLVRITPRVRAV